MFQPYSIRTLLCLEHSETQAPQRSATAVQIVDVVGPRVGRRHILNAEYDAPPPPCYRQYCKSCGFGAWNYILLYSTSGEKKNIMAPLLMLSLRETVPLSLARQQVPTLNLKFWTLLVLSGWTLLQCSDYQLVSITYPHNRYAQAKCDKPVCRRRHLINVGSA